MTLQPASSMNLRMTVYSALFTALIIIGGYISIPIGPVPIALADFFVMLAGLFLGPRWGLSSVLLFLFLGALGLPVFAGGKAGLAVFMGPTGGFLPGYVLMVFAVGFLSGRGKLSPDCGKQFPDRTELSADWDDPSSGKGNLAQPGEESITGVKASSGMKPPSVVNTAVAIAMNAFALLIGNILLYAVGIPWLKIYLSASWTAALAAGLTPFLPGVIIKIAVVVAISQALLPRFRQSVPEVSFEPAQAEDD